MSQYYRTLIQNAGLLDIYTGATVAFSVRKLSNTYSGFCMKVRRSGDDSELDIGFSGGLIDSTALLTFIGENFTTFSEDLTQTTWVKSFTTISGNTIVAPDGNTTGDKVLETATNSTHQITKNTGSLTTGVTYNISVYIKAGERTKCLFLSSVSGLSRQATIDLTTGVISGSTFDIPLTISQVGSTGWWRVSAEIVAGTTSSSMIVRLLNDVGAQTYLGDVTKGIYVWGAQFTISSSVKSYYKTVADFAGKGFIRTWYDQSGNINHAFNSTPSSQPQIALSSSVVLPTIVTDPTTGKISTNWTLGGRSLSLTTSFFPSQKIIQTMVFNRTSGSQYSIGLGNSVTASVLLFWGNDGTLISRWNNGAITHVSGDTGSTGSFLITTLRDGSNSVKMWRNNSPLTSGSNSSLAGAYAVLGKYTSPQHVGYMGEVVVWKQDYESVRSGIEQNINSYFNAY
jgi:hypothetical protein